MDINRISLYLSGKFPPYYGAPFDKLEFIEIIRAKSPTGFSDDFFRLVDSQEFYSMCLNRTKRADEAGLIEVLKTLKIPEDAGGLSKSDLLEDKLVLLEKEYKEMFTATNVHKRGYDFERWLLSLFDAFNLKPRASYKTDLDQIDGSFELDGKEYLLEAKWLGKEADTSVVDRLYARLDRCLVGTVGLAISQTGFTDNSIEATSRHKNLLLLTGHDLLAVVERKIDLGDLLRSIRRRMAEEGKPYSSINNE